MKAVVLHKYGAPSELKYEDFPDPVAGEGEVLVRVAAVSINPVDVKMRSGAAKDRFPVEFPGILGRDVSGTVRSVGPGVGNFAPGDKVFALAWKTYAELCLVKASELAKVPEHLELANAAALPLILATGDQLIRLGAKVEANQTVLVTGALGAVGRAALFVAKQAGAHVIAGVRKSQLEQAASLGADHVLALDDKGAVADLGLVDAIADTVGGETAAALLGKVKPGGIFASVLGPPSNAALHPTINIAPIMAHPDPERLVILAQEVAAGHLTIPIDRLLPLQQAAEGHAAVEKGSNGKVLLVA